LDEVQYTDGLYETTRLLKLRYMYEYKKTDIPVNGKRHCKLHEVRQGQNPDVSGPTTPVDGESILTEPLGLAKSGSRTQEYTSIIGETTCTYM
jgi:hypothetical protein